MGEAASCANGYNGWAAKWGKRPAVQMGTTAGRPTGGSGQLCKWVQRLAGKMGEAASCANWAGQKMKWARLQQS